MVVDVPYATGGALLFCVFSISVGEEVAHELFKEHCVDPGGLDCLFYVVVSVDDFPPFLLRTRFRAPRNSADEGDSLF